MHVDLRRRVGKLLGKEPLAWARVERGYTPAERWRVSFGDGSSVFVKAGTTPDTARWLRDEHAVYAQLHGSFMPRLLGFDDHPEQPLLVLEDLSAAHWPPPWRPGDVERVLGAHAALAATSPLPRGLRALESERTNLAVGSTSSAIRSRFSRSACARGRGWRRRCRCSCRRKIWRSSTATSCCTATCAATTCASPASAW